MKTFAFPETFTILHSFRFFAMDFAPRRKISLLYPVPVKGRFRERQEAVRDATGPSRLSKSLRLVLRRIGRNRSRVTYGSRGRTAQGSSNAVEARIQSSRRRRGGAGSCKPLIRRVRSAGVKTTVHRCESLLVCANAHQAAGSYNAHAFRTPFRGRTEATTWRGDFEEKARETTVASPGADKPGVKTRVCGYASGCASRLVRRSPKGEGGSPQGEAGLFDN